MPSIIFLGYRIFTNFSHSENHQMDDTPNSTKKYGTTTVANILKPGQRWGSLPPFLFPLGTRLTFTGNTYIHKLKWCPRGTKQIRAGKASTKTRPRMPGQCSSSALRYLTPQPHLQLSLGRPVQTLSTCLNSKDDGLDEEYDPPHTHTHSLSPEFSLFIETPGTGSKLTGQNVPCTRMLKSSPKTEAESVSLLTHRKQLQIRVYYWGRPMYEMHPIQS